MKVCYEDVNLLTQVQMILNSSSVNVHGSELQVVCEVYGIFVQEMNERNTTRIYTEH